VKKFLFFIFCLLATFLQANLHYTLIDEDRKPTPCFNELLDALSFSDDRTFEQIVVITQNQWMQKGKKRWEFAAKEEDKRELLLPFLHKLKCFEEIAPQEKNYDYAIVLGALSSRIERRLSFLIELWQRGIRFKQLVFLSSDRPILRDLEKVPNGINTESELLSFTFKNLSLPEQLRKIPLQVISSPLILNQKKVIEYPNTGHTFLDWLKSNPKPGTCLIISDQPFVGYQDAVAQSFLPSSFSCETVGMSAQEDLPIAIYLDNLAKWLYQEFKYREQHHEPGN